MQAARGSHRDRNLHSPLQPLCFGLPNFRKTGFRLDALRWLHAAGLCSKHCGGRGKGKPTIFFSGEVGRWQATDYCSPEIQRDTDHLWGSDMIVTSTSPDSTLRCESVTRWPRWTELIKSWVSRWHAGHLLHLRPSRPRLCLKRASKALIAMKALAGSNWGYTTKTLVATYKFIMLYIINYATPNWFTQVTSSHSHLGKLEVIQKLWPEQGSEDRDRLPSKGQGVPH